MLTSIMDLDDHEVSYTAAVLSPKCRQLSPILHDATTQNRTKNGTDPP
jgi:hypothetical protein